MKVGKNTFIAKNAVIIGDVEIGEKCSIWYNAILRADLNRIYIGDESNIQDCCVIHCSKENSVTIGKNVSVGHGAIVHGAKIEDDCIIGINSTVLDGSKIGKGSIVAANAIVLPNTVIPPNSLVAGVPAKVIREDEKLIEEIRKNSSIYVELAERYLKGGFEEGKKCPVCNGNMEKIASGKDFPPIPFIKIPDWIKEVDAYKCNSCGFVGLWICHSL
ncbi:MAG: gamma carbonic anhydrase family protein [Thermoplasmatales archaeon]|nr:gamma carbonic anhydrase family protein [Thermoplasmatales archaeon]